MTGEIRTIKVLAYRDASGAPTCCVDWPSGDICRFMAMRKLGFVEVCGATHHDLKRVDGFLRPDAACPIWSEAGVAALKGKDWSVRDSITY